MTRDELIWKMAEGAWAYHYCPSGAVGNFCETCEFQRSSSGEVECFELSGGFKRGPENMEWRWAGEGALHALEGAMGVQFLIDAPANGEKGST